MFHVMRDMPVLGMQAHLLYQGAGDDGQAWRGQLQAAPLHQLSEGLAHEGGCLAALDRV